VRSCHKRPVSISQINNMVDEIETQIFNIGEKEISTKTIGEIVMSKLKNVDEVAYVRFASVYREFKDVDSFMEEIKKILK
ncbi:MAG: ATP cone domain-containing protein, partial [Lachnospira eligens]